MVMSVEAQPVETAKDGTAEVQHGAHIECQREAEFVVLVCGIAADWSERYKRRGLPLCPTCKSLARCPVCGTQLRGWIA